MKKSAVVLFIMLSLFNGRAFAQDFIAIKDSLDKVKFDKVVAHIFTLEKDKPVADTLAGRYNIMYKTLCPFIVTTDGDCGAMYTSDMRTMGQSLLQKKVYPKLRNFYNFHFCAENSQKYVGLDAENFRVYSDSLTQYIAVSTNTGYKMDFLAYYLSPQNYMFKNGASYGNGQYLILERYGIPKTTQIQIESDYDHFINLDGGVDTSYTETLFLKRVE